MVEAMVVALAVETEEVLAVEENLLVSEEVVALQVGGMGLKARDMAVSILNFKLLNWIIRNNNI